MRKIVSTLLLVTTLFANLSWAADTHAEAYFGHGTEWSQDKFPVPDGHGNCDDCDCCCHGVVHLMGLVSSTSVVMSHMNELDVMHFETNFQNLEDSPPIPPPNYT